tara:strand:+ start:6680 stop:7606 length:927 start_codon:yes stop_codon:yes gene_type:complete
LKNSPYPNFLIVGMERSGTHWVAALLNNHPKIACFPSLPWRGEEGGNKLGEVHFFDTIASLEGDSDFLFTRPFEDFLTKYNKVFKDLVPLKDKVSKEELYKKLVERYSEYCDDQKGNKDIVGEGTPAYVFYLDFIDKFYPNIKKIASIRDPKDKIVSWHFNLVRKDKKKKDDLITEEFAMDYLEKRIVPEYEALLAYNDDVHVVTYENMHNNTKDVARGFAEYLGFKTSDEELEYMVTEADFDKQTVKDALDKATRKQGEEDVKSGLRKGIVGDWKNNISNELAKKIDSKVANFRKKVFDKYHVTNVD